MPAISSYKHIARSRYRDAIMADNPLWYIRMKIPRGATFPYVLTDETDQYTVTFSESVTGVLTPAASGLIKADASPSLRWSGTAYGGGTITHETSLHPTGSFSIETWFVQYDSQTVSIVTKDRAGSIWPEYVFNLIGGNVGSTLYRTSGTSGLSQLTSPLAYNDGEVHYAAMTFDTDANIHSLYVDGVLVDSNSWTFVLYTNTRNISIGQQENQTVSRSNMELDEVAMYHYALSPGQIAHHYDVGRAYYRNYRETIKTAGPISYWRLGGGSIVDDEMKLNDLSLVGPLLQQYTSPMFLEEHNKDRCIKFNGDNTDIVSGVTTGLNGLLLPDTSVQLLLHMDGTDASTTFTDSSSYNRTVTPSGNAQIDTAQQKFGSASGLFDGSGDYLTVPHDAALDLTGLFTISMWVYVPTSHKALACLISKRPSSGVSCWAMYHNSTNGISFAMWNTSSGIYLLVEDTTNPIPVDQWVHIEAGFDGTTYRLFVNGVVVASEATTTGTYKTASNNVLIGRDFSTPTTRDFDGWMDELSVTTDSTRHTANFTPPTYADITYVCIECWIFPLESKLATICGTDDFTDGWQAYTRIVTAGGMRIAVLGRSPGALPDGWETTNPIPINQWTHIVINYQYDLAPTFIINGVEDAAVGPIFGTPTAGTPPSDAGNLFHIGENGTPVNPQPFNGYISDVAIYNRALTAKEASQHYKESNLHIATEDFYGYKPGSFFPGNVNPSWTIEQANATYTIIDATASVSKHLSYTMTATGESYTTYKDVPPFVNGVVQGAIAISAIGNTNRQPTLLMRYQDAANNIQVRIAHADGIYINDRIGGVDNFTSVVYSFTTSVVYYTEVIMDGTLLTVNVYSDVDRSTLLVTLPATVNNTTAGKVGFAAIGVIGTVSTIDNFRVDVLDRDIVDQYYSDVIRDTPLHYWRLGEALTTNPAVDEVGGNNGTYNDTPTLGIVSLTSDSNQTSMRTRGTIVSNVGEGMIAGTFSAPNDLTVECWYKNTGASDGASGALCNMYNNSNGFLLTVEKANGRVHFDGKTGNGTYISNVGTTDVDDGNIHHIVGVKRGLVGEIWVDGVKEVLTVSANFAGNITNTTNSVRVGYHYAQTGGSTDLIPMNGTIDEVAIYDYALDPHQVLSHYESGTPTYAPRGHWEMDELAGTVAENTGFEVETDGTYVNTPTLGATRLTKSGTAVTFNGTNQKLDTNILQTSEVFTWMCWFSCPDAPNASKITGPMYGESRGISWHHTSGAWQGAVFMKTGASTWVPTTLGTLLGNTTYHLAITYDGATCKAYTDGVMISSFAFAGPVLPEVATLKLMVDRTNSTYQDGTLDDARMYDRALTAEELFAVYDAGAPSPARGLWELDETSGTNAANVGLGADGTYVGAPTLGVTGLTSSGTAVTFDGSTQYVETGIIIPASTSITMMCWVNIPHAPVTGANLGPMYQDSVGIIWDHISTDYRGAAYIYRQSPADFPFASFGTLLANTTYHLAMTYNGVDLKAYKNGVLITTTNAPGIMRTNTTSLRLMETSHTSNRLDGTLDDARYYDDVAMTADDILAIYNAGL